MKTQRVNLFSRSSCVRCGQPVGSAHLLVSVVGSGGRRRRFCGARCLAAWSAGLVSRRLPPSGGGGTVAWELRELAIERATAGDALTLGGFAAG
jgi:hypothetical protein